MQNKVNTHLHKIYARLNLDNILILFEMEVNLDLKILKQEIPWRPSG